MNTKIEIITLHRITNFGSMLQTYATQTAIEKLGYRVEVIDFVPDGITFKRSCWPKNDAPVWKKVIKLFPLFVVNILEFYDMNKFVRKYIHTTKQRYNNYQEIIDNVPLADVYISGSDQVWNTQNNNSEDDLKAYYLGFVPNGKKRIAYAGSFGKNYFTKEESLIIRDLLARYDSISVREDEGLNILERHGVKNGVHVVDPTLLLDAEEWRAFANKTAPKPGYIFVYNLNRNQLLKELAIAISKDKRLRIINFADTFDFIFGAENHMLNSALDFINFIANADMVLTDSFHGTAFSINFGRQFIVTQAPRYNSRLDSILRQTGLRESRMVNNIKEGLQTSREIIDYTEINKLIYEARKKSYGYLQQSLKH